MLAQISFPGSHQANLAELRHFTVDGKTAERVSDKTDYAALAAGTFGVPNLPIDAARAALAARR